MTRTIQLVRAGMVALGHGDDGTHVLPEQVTSKLLRTPHTDAPHADG